MHQQRQAVLYIVIAIVAGTTMDALLKVAGGRMGTWNLLALRWLFALVILLPVALRASVNPLRMHAPRVHIARGVLNCLGSYALFYALTVLPLSVVMTILFAEPIFVIPFAALLLRERLGVKDALAALLGLGGVILMGQPGAGPGDWTMVLPMLAAGSFALLHVLTKKWGSQESPISLMIWMAISTLLMTAPFATGEWTVLPWGDYALVLFIAFLGSVFSYFWILGLRLGAVARLSQLTFLSLPLAYGIGWLFFNEVPGPAVIGGGLLIVAAVALLSLDMARLGAMLGKRR